MTPPLLTPILTDILTGTIAALSAAGAPVSDASLTPGELPAWDSCCDGGGQLWVRVLRVTPGGVRDDRRVTHGCPSTWIARVGVGVIRCVATVDDNGLPPTPDTLTAEAVQMHEDAHTIAQRLLCEPIAGTASAAMEEWVPLGPDGGCAGGEWVVALLLADCGC